MSPASSCCAVGLPISRYAIRHGVDIDLLTRGASFGYIGSTITSLIYASFTFMLFAIEASIMSAALELALGIPLWIGYIISAVMVIPLVTHGVRLISKFQLITQPFWIVLNILPFIFIALRRLEQVRPLARLCRHAACQPARRVRSRHFRLAEFGAASAVILALMAQIGEQVDFLRFLPPEGQRKLHHRDRRVPGRFRLGDRRRAETAGRLVPRRALRSAPAFRSSDAADPAHMYLTAFGYMIPWHNAAALLLMAAFVVVSQLKINVMNAYAGSLAWSNFFSRLTHSHPGRVVWLMFNVAIALLSDGTRHLQAAGGNARHLLDHRHVLALHDLGRSLRQQAAGSGTARISSSSAPISTMSIRSASAPWRFRRLIALTAHFGLLRRHGRRRLAPYIALIAAFIASPAIAWATKGKYYLARKPRQSWKKLSTVTCSICEHPFEPEDMAWCPAYSAPICSLCCSLDSRCHDMCKPHASFNAQTAVVAKSPSAAEGHGNALHPPRALRHCRRPVRRRHRHRSWR